jgi:MFS family permease
MAFTATTLTTYRFERWRAVANGALEMAGSTFLLLIVVRWPGVTAWEKALVAGGGSAGLLLSPLVVWYVSRQGWTTTWAASVLSFFGALVFLGMAAFPILPLYVVGCVVTMACASASVPLMTQVYQENYPASDRGRLFSRAIMIRIGTAAVFSDLAGRGLAASNDPRWLLVVFAVAFAGAGYCLSRVPSRPLVKEAGSHPFRAMRYIRLDPLFRRTLICWMLMGVANLMMLPLRVEFLANPKYEQNLDVVTIALFVGVVPNMVRFILSPIWGMIFDRMNFFALRVILNLGFAAGILAFFTSNSFEGLLLGAVIYGVAGAGGDVAWSLWVTKFAPPDRVADYMSVHTFFTGVRGVLAPVVAFPLAMHWPLSWLAGFCVGLIVIASLLLLPEVAWDRNLRGRERVIEDVND